MSMHIIAESCCCGADFSIATTWWAHAEQQLSEFRRLHARCSRRWAEAAHACCDERRPR